MANIQVGLIGLGKFGLSFGQALEEQGAEVLGLDRNLDKIRQAEDQLTSVFQADATDAKALEQLGFAEFSHAVVSVGASIEASCLITLHLKELQVANVWVKAVSQDHERLLQRIGATQVVFPERYAAYQLAGRVLTPGLVDRLPIGEDEALVELTVNDWHNRTLRELDLTNQLQVQVIAVKPADQDDYNFIPRADEPLSKGDALIVLGKRETVGELKA